MLRSQSHTRFLLYRENTKFITAEDLGCPDHLFRQPKNGFERPASHCLFAFHF